MRRARIDSRLLARHPQDTRLVSSIGSSEVSMRGRMMDYPLTLTHFLERANLLFPRKEIITRTAAGLHRYTYADLYRRAGRLANALRALGVREGDRVASFAWNTFRHLELYLGVPCSGAVLHTLNIRLFPEQVVFIANHAEDAVLCVDESLLAALEPLAPELKTVRAYIVMGDGPLPQTRLHPVYRYEDLLAAAEPQFDFPRLDENTAAAMCYTSGTTGNPKGVVYSHRALALQSLVQASADAFAIREADVIMPVVPMFHANAWGLPFTATMVGATQVYPGVQPTPADVTALVQDLRVTVTGGVPTVLIGMLAALEQQHYDLSSLRCVPCGGSAVPASLIERFDALGVAVVQAWGMTETAPLATISRLRSWMQAGSAADRLAIRARQGYPLPYVDLRVVDDAGAVLPRDAKSAGELEVRGPWIVESYHDDTRSSAAFHEGWFRTGDIATIDPDGYIQITDRAKDVIKSGGEWISSVELENHIMAHPQVLEAAVVGLPHERWQERPLACVVVKPGSQLTKEAILQHLEPRVAKWWLPEDVVFVDALPKTSVGKVAKRDLRDHFRDHFKEYRWK
jgi:fatty-acyl-CoA synthase